MGWLSDIGNIVTGVGSVASAAGTAYAANRAADAQVGAARNANELQREIYRQNRADMEPYRAAGYGALDRQAQLLGMGDDSRLEALRDTPGYQFTQDEAMRGVERSQAAKGMALSGNTLKALQDRSASIADQTYGNQLNRYASLAGTGQSATQNTAAMGQNYAANAGQNMMGAGRAQAQGYAGMARAGNQLLNNLQYTFGG